MRVKAISGLLLVAASALAIGACQAATPPPPTAAATTAPAASPKAGATTAPTAPPAVAKPSGNLRIGISSAPRSFDLHVDWQGTAGPAVQSVAESLVEIVEEGKLQPVLATEWSVGADQRTWTFKLRPNIRFSNGDPVTAADVKYSMESFVNPANAYPSAFRLAPFLDASGVTIVDPQTVQMVSRNPDAIFPRRTSLVAVVSQRSAQPLTKEDYATKTQAATGPFMVKSVQTGQKITLETNPNAWRPARIAQMEYNILLEQAVREAALRTGDIELATVVIPEIADRLRRDGKTVLAIPNASVVQILIDTATPNAIPVMKDRRVREAMNIGIDRQAIVTALLFGFGEVASGTVPPDVFGYAPLPPRALDVARARQLIRDAGAEGTSARLAGAFAVGSGLTSLTAAQAVAGQLNNTGLRIEIESLELATYLDRYNNGALPLSLFTLNGVYTDADGILSNFRDRTNTARNTVRYSNPEFDTAYLAAQSEFDTARRAELLARATRIMYDDFANVPVGITRSQFAYDGNKLRNFKPIGVSTFNWTEMTLN